MKKTKFFVIVSIILMIVIAFAGCADADGNGPKSSPKPSQTPAAPGQTATRQPTAEVTASAEATAAATATPEATKVPRTPVPTVEPGKETYAGSILDANTGKMVYFDEENPQLLAALSCTGDLAVQFFATVGFNALHLRLCTWQQTSGHSVTLTLYPWLGTYDDTLKGEPVFTQEYSDYADNIWLKLELGETLPDGEYLLEIWNEQGRPNVGVWGSMEETGKQRLYKDGYPFEDYEGQIMVAQFAVDYVKTPEQLYGPLSEPGV